MFRTISSAVLLALAFTSNVNASSVSLVGPGAVVAGSTFEIAVIGDFDDVGFTAGAIQIFYQSALATVVNFDFSLNVDADESCPGGALCPPDSPGMLSIAWIQPASDLIAPNAGPTLMGTITMKASSTLGRGENTLALMPVDFGAYTGGWFGAGAVDINTPELIGTSVQINAIPLPAALWLLAGGLGTLAGLRRK